MEDRYIILEIEGIERSYALDGLNLTIGRSTDNTISLQDTIISSKHGRIFVRGLDVLFEDMRSRNGTFVDGRFIRGESVILGGNGRVVFGTPDGPGLRYRLSDKPAGKVQWGQIFTKAYGCLKDSDHRQAYALFEHLLDEGNAPPIVYYYAGYAASKLNRVDTAILHMEQYLAVLPRDFKALVDLGKLYERKGIYPKAAARYKKALEIKPGDDGILLRIRDLDRFEPVSDAFRKGCSTEEILGADLSAVVETRHFRVSYHIARHGRRLNDVLKILEEAYQVCGRHLGIYPQSRVPVVLVSEERKLEVDTMRAAGSASKEGIRVLISPATMTEETVLYVQLVHEYIHYVLYDASSGGEVLPWWLHEGLAQYESQNLRSDSDNLMRNMLSDSALIPLSMMDHGVFDEDVPGLVQLAYAQSYSLVEYCIVTYGWESLQRLIRGLCNGNGLRSYSDAGIEHDVFEKSWQDWLKNRSENFRKGRTVRL